MARCMQDPPDISGPVYDCLKRHLCGWCPCSITPHCRNIDGLAIPQAHAAPTLAMAELNDATLIGAVVYGADEYEIGTIAHVRGQGRDMQVIVDVSGFLGISNKKVSLSTSQLNLMRDEAGMVHAITARTIEQVEATPEHLH